ncbi:hypothetical protein DH2020_044722 [Rehmannia glutinosa]|uniref:Uncharacterized protein n=1 Tax=Rehmannia glutinosa TaxID=99300 RepID=A0ABR0UGW6_REHGL
MVSSKRVNDFKWMMQGHEFTYSLMLLENEGCDLILGGDWLKSCTPIELDYDKMTFTVTFMGRRIKIQALRSIAECKMISGPSLYKLINQESSAEVEAVYVVSVNNTIPSENSTLHDLLTKFEDILARVTKLHKHRNIPTKKDINNRIAV